MKASLCSFPVISREASLCGLHVAAFSVRPHMPCLLWMCILRVSPFSYKDRVLLDYGPPIWLHLTFITSLKELPWWLRWWRIHLQCGRPEFDPCIGKIPWRRAWQPTPVFLLGESPWTEEPGGLQSMGSQIVRHVWETKHTAHTSLKALSSNSHILSCTGG